MSRLLKLSLLLLLFVSSVKATQISDLPKQFLGLISNEIKQFYDGLTSDEKQIIEMVDASNHTESNYTAVYKEFNKALGEKAEEYVNKEAAKILKLEASARNFYLQILQLPNQLKLINGGKRKDWKRMAKELLVQYDKLPTESKATFKEQYPEVSETLTGDELRQFAGLPTTKNAKDSSN
ncbi:Fatty-acid and retinol-binding protein 6 [Aphelenchoides bicaudatus]|nr:Fatty-acid and retinol-binding protein 6 [Aphelenchoides bicaudatus]